MNENQGILRYLIKKKALRVILSFFVLISICGIGIYHIPVEIMPRGSAEEFLFVVVKLGKKKSIAFNEKTYTMPFEQSLKIVPNINSISSTTAQDKIAALISFKPNTPMDYVLYLLNETAAAYVESKGISQNSVSIFQFNPEDRAIFSFGLTLAKGSKTKEFIDHHIKNKLMQIEGIARVNIQGIPADYLDIKIPFESLRAIKVKPKHLGRRLRPPNFRDSFGQAKIFADNNLTNIGGIWQDFSIENFLRTTVKKNTKTRIKQISELEKYSSLSRSRNELGNSQMILVNIFKKEGANIFDINGDIKLYLAALSEKYEGLKLITIADESKRLDTVLSDVFSSLYLSILITFCVVLLFIRRLYPTFLIAASIPITLLVVVFLLYITGKTLNVVTLSGLILVIGLIVDNAIVVVESIYRKFEQTGLMQESSAVGATEVALPLFMSTITTVIIFLPSLFIESEDSFTVLLKAFQEPVIYSMFASYLIALIYIPVAAAKGNGELESKSVDLNDKSTHFFAHILRNRFVYLGITLVCTAYLYKAAQNLESTDITPAALPYVDVGLTFNLEVKYKERLSIYEEIKSAIIDIKNKPHIQNALSNYSIGDNYAAIKVYPHDSDFPEHARFSLINSLKKILKSFRSIPGINISIDGEDFFEIDSRRKKMKIDFSGPNSVALNSQIKDLTKKILHEKGVVKVEGLTEAKGKESFVILPDTRLLHQYKLSTEKLAAQVNSAFLNISVGELSNKNDWYETNVKVIPEFNRYQWNMQDLINLPINLDKETIVPLKEVGKIVKKKVENKLSRKDSLASLPLYVFFDENIKRKEMRKLKRKIKKIAKNHDFDEGYGIKTNDYNKKIEAAEKRTKFVILLAIFFIYLVLASLFESVFIPFSIMLTVPVAILFGMMGLYLLDYLLDPMARMGLIVLVGIIVNNAIMLVDVIRRYRAKGFKNFEAITLGCSNRLKAIAMTTCTTVFGLLPVALSNTKVLGIPFASLGVCIISGMTFSTIVTFGLVPISYTFFDSLEIKLKNLIS